MLVDALSDTNMATLKDKISTVNGAAHRLEKVASLNIDNREDLTKEAFAWPEEKLFPIYSPSHALVSSVYLEDNEAVPNFVKEACEEACALFGLDVQIGTLQKVAEEKEELEASDFLLPAQRKLPAVNSDTLRMSKSALEKVAYMLAPEDLVVANRQLVKKASEFGDAVSDNVLSLGLYGTINSRVAKDILKERKLLTGDNEYEKIASDIKSSHIYSTDKVASLIFDVISLDKKNNFEKTAEETILEMVLPGEVSDTQFVGDEEFPTEKIASIDAENWLDIFSRPVVEELFSNDGELDIGLFKELSDGSSIEEKEAIAMFIANK